MSTKRLVIFLNVALVLSFSGCTGVTVTNHEESRLIGPRTDEDSPFLGAAGGLMDAGKKFGEQQKSDVTSEQKRLQEKYPNGTFRSL